MQNLAFETEFMSEVSLKNKIACKNLSNGSIDLFNYICLSELFAILLGWWL